MKRLPMTLALVAAVALMAGISPAAGVSKFNSAQWRRAISFTSPPGRGCFTASYPTLEWHAARCKLVPDVPSSAKPRIQPLTPTSGLEPHTVGDTQDYLAHVDSPIDRATGSFSVLTPNITETGVVHGVGPAVADSFDLQLNTEFFTGAPICANSPNADCTAWEQFIYDSHDNGVFIQYWLLDYNGTSCPDGWMHFGGDAKENAGCFTNSSGSSLSGPALTAADLGEVQLSGLAQPSCGSGPDTGRCGNDIVGLAAGNRATSVSGARLLDLSQFWHSTEFGVYGDGKGGEADFAPDGAKLIAKTVLYVGDSPQPPTCIFEPSQATAETNNLTLTETPLLTSPAPYPEMDSEQVKQVDGSGPIDSSCATASATIATETAPASAGWSQGTNRTLYTAATTPDGAIWQNSTGDLAGQSWENFAGWSKIPGGVTTDTAPAAAEQGTTLFVFVTTNSKDKKTGPGQIEYNQATKVGPFAGWRALPLPKAGSTVLAPAAVGRPDGHVFVFVTAKNGQIWMNQAARGRAFVGWKLVPGLTTKTSVAAAEQGATLVLFARTASGKLEYTRAANSGTFGAWQSLSLPSGRSTAVAPAAVGRPDGHLFVFVTTTSRQIWMNQAASGQAFTGWKAVPGLGARTPVGAGELGTSLVLFADSPTARIYFDEAPKGGAFYGWQAL